MSVDDTLEWVRNNCNQEAFEMLPSHVALVVLADEVRRLRVELESAQKSVHKWVSYASRTLNKSHHLERQWKGQVEFLWIAGSDGKTGHWYSPESVHNAISMERESCAQIAELVSGETKSEVAEAIRMRTVGD